MSSNQSELRLGVAYYPEHDPESDWELDARLMRELGIDTIRIGEFCWNRMQRADGSFTLDWLERCIALFGRYGIQTILCTPTATPPIWLCERYPDLPFLKPDGTPGLFGGRRHYSPFHEGYRECCRRIATGLGERFGRNPHVVGWQIDNEAGSYSLIDCSPPARHAFHQWVARKYGSVDELNRRWGLIFWNQEIERFDQLPAPIEMMSTRNPSYLLDYNRFCADGFAEFLLIQAEALRPQVDPRQFVVASAIFPVLHRLFQIQAERDWAPVDAVTYHSYPELWNHKGQAALQLDLFRSLSASREFLTLEHQIGSGYTTTGGFNSATRRCWSFETLAYGSRAILWFHWRRFRTGCEWRLTPVVERDRKPRENFRSLQGIVRDMRRADEILRGGRLAVDVQLLFSFDNALGRDRSSEPLFWMEIQLPDGYAQRFPMWIKETLRAAYNPLAGFGLNLDFVAEDATWDPAKPLVATDLDICTPALRDKLQAFCEAGGTLICFPGAGERDECGAHREAPPPGLLASLFGVELRDYFPLEADCGSAFDHQAGQAQKLEGVRPDNPRIPIRVGTETISFDARHAEVLELTGAQALGIYGDGISAGQPALACRSIGRGRAIYLGAVPSDEEAATQLYRILLPGLTGERIHYQRVTWDTPRGRYAFLINRQPYPVPLTPGGRDEITGCKMSELPGFGVALMAR
jgi:beta-galactosidase